MKKGSNLYSVFCIVALIHGRDVLVGEDARLHTVEGSFLSVLASRRRWYLTEMMLVISHFATRFLRQ